MMGLYKKNTSQGCGWNAKMMLLWTTLSRLVLTLTPSPLSLFGRRLGSRGLTGCCWWPTGGTEASLGGQNWVESWPWICLWHVRQTIHSPSPAVLMETFPSVGSRKLRGQTQDLKTPGGAVVPSGFRDGPQIRASQVVLVVKNSPVNAGDIRDAGLILGWEGPMEKQMAPTPVFLPGESHG